jgi:Kef-type K+ transport system membrane component KefB
MSLGGEELARLLAAITLLLVAAHAFGYVFARFRQPRVIGEILGGLVLGPTVLGAIAPGLQETLFPSTGPTPLVLDALYQLGLLLLMFGAGAEVRVSFDSKERRTVGAVTITGMVVPFLVGLAFVSLLPEGRFLGPADDQAAFVLVFALAIAVTSIPVISRIMQDLGILETSFARIVLAVAVIEDVVVYVLLAIALGFVSAATGEVYGLQAVLGIEGSGAAGIVYHTVATVGFLLLSLWLGPLVYRSVLRTKLNLVKRSNPIAFQVVFMFVMTVIAASAGVTPLFGAFAAGIVVGSTEGAGAQAARDHIRTFAMAFFIPIYFAIVGLRLDLIHGFDLAFFLLFLVVACVAKAASVWAGARLAGESPSGARNLAIALNARGGPGIVLASVAFDAAIIDQTFYAVLVMLAIVTSLLAGSWLERVIASGQPLR